MLLKSGLTSTTRIFRPLIRWNSIKSIIKKKLNYQEDKGVLPPLGDPSWEWYEHIKGEQTNENELGEEVIRGSHEAKFSSFGNQLVTLPKSLKEGIQELLKEGNTTDIRSNALKLFTSYQSLIPLKDKLPVNTLKKKFNKRPDLPTSKPHILSYNKDESLAYMAAVMPGFYGCIHKVLSEVRLRVPDLNPTRILDFGTGPGTCLWAAKEVFGNEKINYYHGVDLSEPMLDAAEKLISLNQNQEDAFKGKIRLERHFSYQADQEPYDLVMACYTLGELPNDILREKAIKELFERCRDTMIIIEKGTDFGFEIIEKARNIIDEQSHIVGPCPHSLTCPMHKSSKWCHFEQSIQRPKFTMLAKNTKSNIEHANYSYLILRKGAKPIKPTELNEDKNYIQSSYYWGKILDRPNKRGGHVNINTCDVNGTITSNVITKSQGNQIYRDARKAKRADLFPHQPKSTKVVDFERFRTKKEDNEE